MKKIEQFFFKYYSLSALENKQHVWVRYVTFAIFIFPIIIAIILDRLRLNYKLPLIIFIILFGGFCIMWIITWVFHYLRIKNKPKDE